MQQLGISNEGLNTGQFLEMLVLPAWQQGLARLAIGAGLPIRLHGAGWDKAGKLAEHWAGPVKSQRDFEAALTEAAALVYAWPVKFAHPIFACARPVVVPGRDAASFLSEARAASEGRLALPHQGEVALSGKRLAELVSPGCFDPEHVV